MLGALRRSHRRSRTRQRPDPFDAFRVARDAHARFAVEHTRSLSHPVLKPNPISRSQTSNSPEVATGTAKLPAIPGAARACHGNPRTQSRPPRPLLRDCAGIHLDPWHYRFVRVPPLTHRGPKCSCSSTVSLLPSDSIPDDLKFFEPRVAPHDSRVRYRTSQSDSGAAECHVGSSLPRKRATLRKPVCATIR